MGSQRLCARADCRFRISRQCAVRCLTQRSGKPTRRAREERRVISSPTSLTRGFTAPLRHCGLSFSHQSAMRRSLPGAKVRQAHEASSWGETRDFIAHELVSWVHSASAPGGLSFSHQSAMRRSLPGAKVRRAHEASSCGETVDFIAHELDSWVHSASAPGASCSDIS